MNKTTWVITGATSIIAQEFAHLAANAGHSLILIGRNHEQLAIISSDLTIRYKIKCETVPCDLANNIDSLISNLQTLEQPLAMFIAQSHEVKNDDLTFDTIDTLINVNVLNVIKLIHGYWQKTRTEHRLIFLSSVAAARGRAKNSLYGASKAAVEVYLQGLQQQANSNQFITIARLGFIDTHQTYGLKEVFYAAPPKKCAKACWRASYAGKSKLYYPFFWRYIMLIIVHSPKFIYRFLQKI